MLPPMRLVEVIKSGRYGSFFLSAWQSRGTYHAESISRSRQWLEKSRLRVISLAYATPSKLHVSSKEHICPRKLLESVLHA